MVHLPDVEAAGQAVDVGLVAEGDGDNLGGAWVRVMAGARVSGTVDACGPVSALTGSRRGRLRSEGGGFGVGGGGAGQDEQA